MKTKTDGVAGAKAGAGDNALKGQAARLIERFTSGGHLRSLVRLALEEDLGPGDLTAGLFSAKAKGRAVLVAKAEGILSGTFVVDAVFREVHRGVKVQWHFNDGQLVTPGDRLAVLSGPMTALLQGERVALNFLQRMCGIATLTRQFVDVVGAGPDRPGIYDTRKTTPLLRALEKWAVLDGGGRSHRFALYDMAMLKDNHIDAAGGISEAVAKLREHGFYVRRPRLGLCIEVRTLDEAVEATWCRADIILLDNMSPAMIRRSAAAVRREADGLGVAMPELEISGGITLRNLKRYAELPVQRISVGALTHSVIALDISMRYEE